MKIVSFVIMLLVPVAVFGCDKSNWFQSIETMNDANNVDKKQIVSSPVTRESFFKDSLPSQSAIMKVVCAMQNKANQEKQTFKKNSSDHSNGRITPKSPRAQ